MEYDRLWERLIEHIAEWASAREVPGGIDVTFEQPTGAPRTVEVVLTPRQWDEYVVGIYGTGDPAVTTLKEKVLGMPRDARCLVYDTYDWWPSDTRELPADEVDPRPGEWVVTDAEGNVIDRLADFGGGQ